MKVSTLSTQLCLGSKLVDWYRYATCTPRSIVGWIVASNRRRLRSCSNTRSIPSKFQIPDRLEQSIHLNHWSRKSLYSPTVPMFLPRKKDRSLSVLSKRLDPVSLRLLSKSSQRTFKALKDITWQIFNKNFDFFHLEAKNGRFGSESEIGLK